MKWGLNLKFICYTVFIVVFISTVFSAVFIYQSRKSLLSEFTNRAESLARNLALNIEVPLLIENERALTALAQNFLKEKDAQSVRIADHTGRVLVELEKGKRLLPWLKEKIVCPVYFSTETGQGVPEDLDPFFQESVGLEELEAFQYGQVIGTVEAMFSRKSIIKAIFRLRWWIFVAATSAAVIGGLAALYFSHSLIMPIQRLAQATYSIARGNWEERLTVQRTDELGRLTESFNIMAESLVNKREQLETTFKELAQKDKMAEIGNFSMIIAHELKNPLGIIKGSVDILDKPATRPDIRQTMIHYIQDEVKRLDKLIADFLAFARPTPPQKTPTNINRVVEKIAGHFRVPEELGKDISVAVSLGELPRMKVDENQIYQVLLNLINNAVQAIEHKGRITVTTACLGQEVLVQVRDTGPGMSEEVRQKVLEPFFTTKAKGTGLGLAIVRKFVENHQGRIEIIDAPGGGTEVTIVLPM